MESGHGDGGEVNRARQRGLLGFRRVPGCMQRLKALIVFLESRQQGGDNTHRTADELGKRGEDDYTGVPLTKEKEGRTRLLSRLVRAPEGL